MYPNLANVYRNALTATVHGQRVYTCISMYLFEIINIGITTGAFARPLVYSTCFVHNQLPAEQINQHYLGLGSPHHQILRRSSLLFEAFT